MGRPLHNILRKQKDKMKVTPQTSALLMEFAKADRPSNAHKLSASIIQKWLNSDVDDTSK
jgi:hypothetical protein